MALRQPAAGPLVLDAPALAAPVDAFDSMKLVLASRAKGPANRAEAWACVTANLALPGSGSLAAGRPVGYFQLALAAIGFIVIVVTGMHLLQWKMSSGGDLNPAGDPVENLAILWTHICWPLAGMGLAAVALLWAGVTSMQILAAHPKNPVPPRIV
jgi:hypothetical protein